MLVFSFSWLVLLLNIVRTKLFCANSVAMTTPDWIYFISFWSYPPDSWPTLLCCTNGAVSFTQLIRDPFLGVSFNRWLKQASHHQSIQEYTGAISFIQLISDPLPGVSQQTVEASFSSPKYTRAPKRMDFMCWQTPGGKSVIRHSSTWHRVVGLFWEVLLHIFTDKKKFCVV